MISRHGSSKVENLNHCYYICVDSKSCVELSTINFCINNRDSFLYPLEWELNLEESNSSCLRQSEIKIIKKTEKNSFPVVRKSDSDREENRNIVIIFLFQFNKTPKPQHHKRKTSNSNPTPINQGVPLYFPAKLSTNNTRNEAKSHIDKITSRKEKTKTQVKSNKYIQWNEWVNK